MSVSYKQQSDTTYLSNEGENERIWSQMSLSFGRGHGQKASVFPHDQTMDLVAEVDCDLLSENRRNNNKITSLPQRTRPTSAETEVGICRNTLVEGVESHFNIFADRAFCNLFQYIGWMFCNISTGIKPTVCPTHFIGDGIDFLSMKMNIY